MKDEGEELRCKQMKTVYRPEAALLGSENTGLVYSQAGDQKFSLEKWNCPSPTLLPERPTDPDFTGLFNETSRFTAGHPTM